MRRNIEQGSDAPLIVDAEVARFWIEDGHDYAVVDGRYVFGAYLRPNPKTESRGMLRQLAAEYREQRAAARAAALPVAA